ncbi:MAG: hypothetical protein ACYC44_01890, partial [Patescibacteria group bacterium]
VSLSKPVATGWVGEYGGFQGLVLDRLDDHYVVKGDTVYAVEFSQPEAIDESSPFPDSNVIATFDPLTGSTQACLAILPACH